MTGKLISTKFIIGNIVELKIRALYKVIKNDYLGTENLTSEIIMTRSKKFYIGSLTYVTLTTKCLENTEFHLYFFTQMQVMD